MSEESGKGENPQLPVTSVVTPWRKLGLSLGTQRKREVRMRMDVDEAGHHVAPSRVDQGLANPDAAPDRGDAAVFDRDVVAP